MILSSYTRDIDGTHLMGQVIVSALKKSKGGTRRKKSFQYKWSGHIKKRGEHKIRCYREVGECAHKCRCSCRPERPLNPKNKNGCDPSVGTGNLMQKHQALNHHSCPL